MRGPLCDFFVVRRGLLVTGGAGFFLLCALFTRRLIQRWLAQCVKPIAHYETWLSWRRKIFRRKQPPLYLSSR